MGNFLLNLNEKLCKPIFAKRIRPKYFQNSQMVLVMLCNGYKICKKICLSYFGINIFWESFCLIQLPKTQRPKTDQKHHGIGSPQSSCTTMCWTCLCQQTRFWKSDWWVFIRKSSFQVLFPTDIYTKQREWFILNLVKKVKALDSQSMGPVFKTTGWLQGRLSLSSFRSR